MIRAFSIWKPDDETARIWVVIMDITFFSSSENVEALNYILAELTVGVTLTAKCPCKQR